MQLQKEIEKFEEAKIQLVAISYDPAESLAKFAKAKNITFPLLSDPSSKTIEAFGILNESAPRSVRGIPHPGTFLVDERGMVEAKLFHRGYRKRHSPSEIIEAAKKNEQ